jgi:DNA-binding GntR family transcriptional regulator
MALPLPVPESIEGASPTAETVADDTFVSRRTVQDSVFARLRSMILSRSLKSGEKLNQSELAERLGVSRTPIREALYQLSAEGFVTFSPHKGASVADFSLEELREIYAVRIPLESYAAYLAVPRLVRADLDRLKELVDRMRFMYQRGDRPRLLEVNREFYSVLYRAAGRRRLYEMIMTHLDLAGIYRRMAFTLDSQYETTVSDHEILLQALGRRDGEAVERLTRQGLEKTAADLIGFLEQSTHNRG